MKQCKPALKPQDEFDIPPGAKTSAIHVWKYGLQPAARDVPLSVLSSDEKEVLGKLSHVKDRIQYFQAHVFLKKVLGRYAHLPAEELRIEPGENGKPMLRCNHSHPPLYFSLSHRSDYALLGISAEPCVGVDVEEVKPVDNFYQFMADYFSPAEQHQILQEKTEQLQLHMLFTFWTMKEAFLKSTASGLSGPLKKYEMQSFLEMPAGSPGWHGTDEWCISPVPVAENYKAAFALKAGKVNCKFFDYDWASFNSETYSGIGVEGQVG